MKYRKLQQGGMFGAYIPDPSPAFPAPEVAPSGASSASGSSSSSFFDDVAKELLKGNMGLENDVYDLLGKMQQLESRSNIPYLSQQTRSEQLALMGQINALKRNKEMWENAYSTAKSNNSLNEIAIGGSGELYAIDNKNNIIATTIDNYKKSRNLRLLSVSEVLEARNSDSKLTNNNKILNVADNSVSMQSIAEYAQNIVGSLGKETESSEFIVNKDDAAKQSSLIADQVKQGNSPSAEVVRGFEILSHAADSPSNYSKIKQTQSSERNHALKAVKYIWSTLGENAKQRLKIQSELSGVSPENLLMDLVLIHTDSSSEYNVTPITDKVAKGGSDEDGEDLSGSKNMNPTQIMMSGTLAKEDQFIFNDPDFNAKFSGTVIGSKPLTTPDNNNNPIGPTTLQGVIKAGYENLVDTSNIYFGNKKVSGAQFSDIITDGFSDVAYVYLPINNDGSVDHQSIEEYSNLMDEYKKNKDSMTIGEIKRLFANSGFDVTVNPDKSLDVKGSNVGQFLVTYGYTNEGSGLSKDNDNVNQGGLKELNRDESKMMERFEDLAWTVGSGKNVISYKPKTNMFKNDRFKGLVYMPVRYGGSVIADATAGAGPKKPVYSDSHVRRMSQNSSNQPYRKANIDSLNDE